MEDTIGKVDLKAQGNAAFAEGNFDNAIALYTKAIEESETPSAVLYTNRAAAWINLGQLEKALEDADSAISIDQTWLKAYYRKATALERLGDSGGVYSTWVRAKANCGESQSLKAQLNSATNKWLKVMKITAVKSVDDFLQRYKLLKTSRERLSTMAHFWNISTLEERYTLFSFFLAVISGNGKTTGLLENISADILPPLPMDNYSDLPSTDIQPWCDYYTTLTGQDKTLLMKGIWDLLSSAEQTTVVNDLKVFVTAAVNNAQVLHAAKDDDVLDSNMGNELNQLRE